METIKGTVVKLIYQNPDNWYSVCDVEADNGKLITVVGIMPYIAVGEGISAVGSWITSKDYGQQFKVEEYEKILPQKKNEILRYLASGAVKGIGAKIAQKIVEIYGEDSFDVIANHPDWLVNIRGISRKKAYEISIDFKEKSDVREILTFCNGTISSNTAVKVYKKWGRNALGIIQDNPYTLCSGDFGIGFKRADEIALGLGFDPSRDERIISGIRYALEIFASRDGHIYVFEDKLCDGVSKLLEVDKNKVVEILNNGTVLDFVHIDSSFKGDNGETQKRVSLRALYNAEQYIAKKLTDINKRAIYLDDANIEHIVHRIELQNGIEYAKMQRLAILKCVNNGVTVLTGGPGTGKTTIIKAVLQIFSNFGLKCALCAPTGRASKRMSEATGCDAKTIHRLLEVSVNDFDGVPKFQRDDKNHLDEDVIIIDESSMIDVSLMNSLLLAIKPGARLILIGDTNQLPSVGEGNVLNDIIKSECFCTVRLTEIFRQARDSGIVINAHKINKGEHPDLT
ncbi:MAG: AAA family ATPase, partial [Clostridia bacterium]|nr:AAA family ATPase [Clostridia bacterium]